MRLDRDRARNERADRLNAARADAIQTVGYTPAVFQTPGALIEANVPRKVEDKIVDS